MNVTANCSILVLSCDKYSDLWDPFFYFFQKNWPDCPYPVYLGSNEKKCRVDNIVTVYSGKDEDWSSSYRKILSRIPSDYILVILEDLFITGQVDTQRINSLFEFMKTKQANHIHFKPVPKPCKILNEGIGIYDKTMPYRVNVAGFWNKRYLLKLLINGESPWNFEIMGSYRSAYDNGFYCAVPGALEWLNSVEKGCWFKKAVLFCKQLNVKIDPSRPVLSTTQKMISFIQICYFNLVMKVNWKIRVKLMNLLRKLLISY